MSDYKNRMITPLKAMASGKKVCIGKGGVCFAVAKITNVVDKDQFTDDTGWVWHGMECWQKK